ncbi:lipid transfer-like protein VAS [Cynara cardunculus var. scolymus]|uniref:Bifunctional inhibitor/plant lipid transfer protein/seed storage helical domain-containing protein n=1 Tax=Cynara cardunculus var. scolymus TaxID=59895 RepID=A0A103XG82_CYNCS|nr:lipid transfer-like protein VAS [Cynara cardunculus var. scolymus]KVH90138.1 Bifunctional inhibitor/plant lipid transfer protein/seed storage helical domain-containing protein [Cynara cardunculus var. scolymus]
MVPSSSPMLLVIAVMVMLVTAQAQTQTASCASKLVSCIDYLNATTTPPSTCCDPIKEAVEKDLPCLCNLYKNPSLFTKLRINITEALRLPSLCGIPNDVSACNADSPSGSKSPLGSAGSDNGVAKIASSGIVGLFLISVCFMLF